MMIRENLYIKFQPCLKYLMLISSSILRDYSFDQYMIYVLDLAQTRNFDLCKCFELISVSVVMLMFLRWVRLLVSREAAL
ncbi:hypothetical protein N665_0306s0010 [Sinapis alba]|nr:hypothetical protein N665_0306s0010 [Sinapis alba]